MSKHTHNKRMKSDPAKLGRCCEAFGVETSTMPNDQAFLKRVITDCRNHSIDPIVFGGWAEEYHGKEPWTHTDVDFLVSAEDLSAIDSPLSGAQEWHEIPLKRFPHKRAATLGGTMVEFCLVRTDDGRFITDFFDVARLV